MPSNDHPILAAIRERRVVRHFTKQPISRDQMVQILRAARWAPSGGNKRLHRFIAVLDPTMIKLIRVVSPGMAAHPTGLIVICTDWEKIRQVGYRPERSTGCIDVGTSAQNMLLAAHALGLGAGPVTSFCKEAVSLLLRLPAWLIPEMIICLGYAAPREPFHQSRPRTPTRLADLVVWERFCNPQPADISDLPADHPR